MNESLPVLIGLGEMVDLFPSVKKQTIYRWRTPDRNLLPEPLLTVSKTPIWRLDDILVWAARRELEVSKTAVRRIRASQAHLQEAAATT